MLTSAFAAAFSAVLFARSASAAGDCTRSYIAKEGDICDRISAANNASTYQLAIVNHGIINAECSNLVPGQSYCLGTKDEDCKTTTVVVAGDTCDGIQAKAGINSTLLWLNNPQINEDCTNIYVGEVLCTAKTVQVPVAPPGATPAATIPATATPAVATSTPAAAPTPAAPVTTAAPAPTTTPAAGVPPPSAKATPSSPAPPESADAGSYGDDSEGDYEGDYEGGDEDDESLPYCDEL